MAPSQRMLSTIKERARLQHIWDISGLVTGTAQEKVGAQEEVGAQEKVGAEEQLGRETGTEHIGGTQKTNTIR